MVARDPFGIKPLYHWDDGRTLLFGSEIRAILCSPGVRREVDPGALEEFVELTYVASAPHGVSRASASSSPVTRSCTTPAGGTTGAFPLG